MTATGKTLKVIHTGVNRDETGDRLDIRCDTFEAVVYVGFGMWPTIEVAAFVHTCGGESPTVAERARVRRAAEKWVKENR